MEDSSTSSDWLNYHHLRYFHAVAREGSLRKAAEKLHVSQPSISAQIKLLEQALGNNLFRRTGRSLALTEFGHLILGYTEEIFTLGRELLSASKRGSSSRTLRLNVGIVDSFPKLLSLDILRPVLTHEPPVSLSCQEGKLDDLLGQLAAHRLDAILADEPPPSTAKVKTFNHALGSSGVTFCASPGMAKSLIGRFPRNLDGAPALLPTQNTALRRDLEKWFREVGVAPKVVAEFEDAALSTIVASDGLGFTVVPTIVAPEALERYGFTALGKIDACRTQLFLITAERRLDHPAVVLLAERALGQVADRRNRPKRSAIPRKSNRLGKTE
jgi:LysR family transcriptional activator of nhaA